MKRSRLEIREAGSITSPSGGGEEPPYRWCYFPGSEIVPIKGEYGEEYDRFRRKRGGKSMADKLASEIMDAFNNQGGAYKRKEDMHLYG